MPARNAGLLQGSLTEIRPGMRQIKVAMRPVFDARRYEWKRASANVSKPPP